MKKDEIVFWYYIGYHGSLYHSVLPDFVKTLHNLRDMQWFHKAI